MRYVSKRPPKFRANWRKHNNVLRLDDASLKCIIVDIGDGLSLFRHQAITRTNADVSSIKLPGTYSNDILFNISSIKCYWNSQSTIAGHCVKTLIDPGDAIWRHRDRSTLVRADLLSIGYLGTNFIEIGIKNTRFSFMKVHLKLPSVKCRPFRSSLIVLTLVVLKP